MPPSVEQQFTSAAPYRVRPDFAMCARIDPPDRNLHALQQPVRSVGPH
jgi:hypothetical protein